MKLRLPCGYQTIQKWNGSMMRSLAESGLFEVMEKEFPKPDENVRRWLYWSVFEIDDWKIGLDTWDTDVPASDFARLGALARGGMYSDLSVILKIQHRPHELWDSIEAKFGIPLRSWTIPASHDFPLGYFQWRPEGHAHTACLTGNLKRGYRAGWATWARQQKDLAVSPKVRRGRDIQQAERDINRGQFLDILKGCKWGVSLKGLKRSSHDGKNRRECEFASCGVPLALNYQPHYEFEMRPGHEFVMLETPEDMAKLRDIDPTPYAEASTRLYEQRFSPVGAAKTLVEILRKLP